MAISICSRDSGTRSDVHTLCTWEQGILGTCLSWLQVQNWATRQVEEPAHDIRPKRKAKGTPVVGSSDLDSRDYSSWSNPALGCDWLLSFQTI